MTTFSQETSGTKQNCFFQQLVLQSCPCLLEHKVMHLFRCSSEMHRFKGGSCHLCDTRCYSSSTTANNGSTFVNVICVLLLLTTSRLAAGHFVNYRNKVSKNKIQIQLVLAPTNLAQQCTVRAAWVLFCCLFCFVIL